MIRGAPGHLQTHDASLDLTGANCFPMNSEKEGVSLVRSGPRSLQEGKVWCGHRMLDGTDGWITSDRNPCFGYDAPLALDSGLFRHTDD